MVPSVEVQPLSPSRTALLSPLFWGLLLLWGAAIIWLANLGTFTQLPGLPPFQLLIAASLPAVLFFAAYRLFSPIQRWVADLDLAHVTAFQIWRVIGIVFLFLLGLNMLPSTMAIVGGVGDILVGVTATLATFAIVARSPGWHRQAYLVPILGMIDFAMVFGLAVFSAEDGLLLDENNVTAAIMQDMPMVLIPAYLVPIFIIGHVIALIKLSHERGNT